MRYSGGEDINTDFRKILGHSVKHGGLGITDPRLSVESLYNTSKAASGELVDYLLEGSALKYVVHRECVRRSNSGARKERKHVELADMVRPNNLSSDQEIGTAAIRQQGMGHGLLLYPTA